MPIEKILFYLAIMNSVVQFVGVFFFFFFYFSSLVLILFLVACVLGGISLDTLLGHRVYVLFPL